MFAMVLQAVDRTSDGLTLGEILTGIPHDAPALFIYVLTAGAVAWVIWANRKRSSGPDVPA
jgi:hypothetical protein